jgi:hypothetical protein
MRRTRLSAENVGHNVGGDIVVPFRKAVRALD